mgnify:CR=1 FL=1
MGDPSIYVSSLCPIDSSNSSSLMKLGQRRSCDNDSSNFAIFVPLLEVGPPGQRMVLVIRKSIWVIRVLHDGHIVLLRNCVVARFCSHVPFSSHEFLLDMAPSENL